MELNQKINSLLAMTFLALLGIAVALFLLLRISNTELHDSPSREQYKKDVTSVYQSL